MRLTQRLDRDIYQIVLKLENDQAEKTARTGEPPKFTVAGVYDTIKRSNSSIAREKKKPLEDAIYRVLHFRKEERRKDQEDDQHDDDQAMDDVPENASPQVKVSLNSRSMPSAAVLRSSNSSSGLGT
jgi:ribosome biogenesis ATPase